MSEGQTIFSIILMTSLEEYILVLPYKEPGKALHKTTTNAEPAINRTSSFHSGSNTSRTSEKVTGQRIKKMKSTNTSINLLDLPLDILLEIFVWLRPSEIQIISHGNRTLQELILRYENHLAKSIISKRYNALSKCFPLPVIASKVDPE